MSSTSLAYGGIGVLFHMNALTWPTVTTESCAHPERIGNKFCPVCGVKVETKVAEQGSRDELVDAFEETNPDPSMFHMSTVWYDPGEYRGYGDKTPERPRNNLVFVGYGVEAGSYGEKVYKSLPYPPPVDVEATLIAWEKAAFAWLKKRDLIPPTSVISLGIGLHVIDYYS